jgi:hypothetical protein
LAAWDARDAGWPYRRQEKTDWLTAQGLPADEMYRIEFFLADMPCARIFCYHLNEDGRRHLDEERIASVEPPRMVPLTGLPPRELLGVPA